MKNKAIKFLITAILGCAMLVGCGNEIAYNEINIGYIVANEEDMDDTLVDGSEITVVSQDAKEYDIILKDKVDIYNKNKAKIGYTKTNLVCCYADIGDGWSLLSNPEYTEIYYARTEELLPVIEVYENQSKNYKDMGIWTRDLSVEIPDGAERFLNHNKLSRVRQDNIQITESISVYNEYGIEWGTLHTGVEFELYAYDDEWAAILQEDGSPIYVKSKDLQAVMGEEYEDMRISNWEGITEEEMFVFIKSAIDSVGMVYDESAFAGVDLDSFDPLDMPDGYGYYVCSMPIENRDEVLPDFVEFVKAQKEATGSTYLLKSDCIRGAQQGEMPGTYYIFKLYMK